MLFSWAATKGPVCRSDVSSILTARCIPDVKENTLETNTAQTRRRVYLTSQERNGRLCFWCIWFVILLGCQIKKRDRLLVTVRPRPLSPAGKKPSLVFAGSVPGVSSLLGEWTSFCYRRKFVQPSGVCFNF